MSFRDLDGSKGRHTSKQQPKQRRPDEDSSFERAIRTSVQELQDVVHKAGSQLEQAPRGRRPSRRAAEALERQLERAEALSEETSRQFRDWTVHLAGEPAERHRKKFSFEKLQKAFDEEVAHLKDASRRAAIARQEALMAPGGCNSPGSARECHAMVDEQDALVGEDGDMESGLLDDTNIQVLTREEEDSTLRIRAVVAQEREDGIRRIQNQVSEVNQMFRDLASIVSEQGQQFESIERQAEIASVNTKQAVSELRKAVDRQRGTRERLCCMLAVAVFLLCFIILPHLHSLHPRLEHMPAGDLPSVLAAEALEQPLLLGTRRQPAATAAEERGAAPAALT